MLLILILMLCAILVRAQTSIGLDLSSLLYKELNIGLDHRISKHWSLHGSAGVNMKILKREIGKEELEHDSNFNSNSQPSVRSYAHREKFGFRYWPNTAYSGMHLNIGGEYRTDAGLDATLGIGYMFPIWKRTRKRSAAFSSRTDTKTTSARCRMCSRVCPHRPMARS